MKANQVQILLGIVCAAGMIGLASSASGATMTYNYTTGGLDGSAWTLMKYTPTTGGNWDTTFLVNNTGTSETFTVKTGLPGNATSIHYRGALVWTAPANEVITQFDFYYRSNLAAANWAPVVYGLAAGDTLDANTTILATYPNNGPLIHKVLTYTEADNLQSIGPGFDVKISASTNWMMTFQTISITTTIIPEPMTAGLLALGGAFLAGLRRRRNVAGFKPPRTGS